MKQILALGLAGCLLISGVSIPAQADTIIKKNGGSYGSTTYGGQAGWLQYERGVNLIAKATPVSDVVRMLPCSVVFENVVSLEKAVVTANLRNATLKEALDAITAQCGLGYEPINNGTVKVYQYKNLQYTLPVTPLSENYQASMGTSGKSGGATTTNGTSGSLSTPFGVISNNGNSGSSTSGSAAGNNGELSLTHRSNVDLWGNIHQNLRILVEPGGGVVTIDPRSSMVFVRCPAAYVSSVEDYMRHMMDALLLSIEVEITIIDVTTNNDKAFGVDWNALFKEVNATNAFKIFSTGGSSFLLEGASNLAPYTLGLSFSSDKHGTQEVVLKALQKRGNVRIVERTTLQLRNNTAASLRRGEDVPYIDSITTTTAGTSGSVSTAVQKGHVLSGVDLGVMASVYKNLVSVSLTPRVTQLMDIQEISAGDTTVQNPRTRIRENLIQVLLTENQTAVVAGAKSSKNGSDGHGIPGLNDIPVIGNLFGFQESLDNGGQVVIMVTPRVYRPQVEEM